MLPELSDVECKSEKSSHLLSQTWDSYDMEATITPYTGFEVLKSTLPPCQVCRAPASGYHYGTNTCEACKVFFRRSLTKHTDYRCKNGRNQCMSSDDYIFNCKSCRFKKCVSEGMSRDRIKIGRYSRERRRENFNKLSEIISNKPSIPHMMNFADADIVTVYCRESFSKFTDATWGKEIHNLYERLYSAILETQGSSWSKEDFMDIVEVTGVEIDGRRSFAEISQKLLKRNIQFLYKFARALPGGKELPNEKFVVDFFNYPEYIKFAIAMSYNFYWSNDEFVFTVDDKQFLMHKNELEHFLDKEVLSYQMEISERKNKLNLTVEETMFVFALQIIKPSAQYPKMGVANQRLNLAFTRYLQTTYGNDYHKRLRDIINFVSFFNEKIYFLKKWTKKNERYLNYLTDCKLMKLFWIEKQPGWEYDILDNFQEIDEPQ
ncbi:DgyrCDS6098 [Dimorphilus gyrociliatus]|uniref:DgyrCDS6098 n=1 Tax=Dimorphilus gyrociliatus TaxID=2664684 RepID=A0A7I8VM14_9ANNE|nr:DgyrCDS6098 [Dimorphilus gyrociliatus]